MGTHLIFGLSVSLFFSFFFTSVEVAFMTANKARLKENAKSGALNARILSFFIERPSWLIGTTRVGYCTALVFFSFFMAQMLLPLVAKILPIAVEHTLVTIFIQIIFSTALLLLIAQFLPKIIGNMYPDRMLLTTASLFGVSFLILFPLTYCILGISKLITINFLHQPYTPAHPLFGITNLNQFFKNIYNLKPENMNLEFDKKILENALEFKTVKIRECMIPRNEITAIDLDEGLDKLQRVFIESGHSKIIIYRKTLDDIIGYCHSSALFTMPARIDDILTPVTTVNENSLASDLMRRFINEKKSLAVVMDEFGGTSGIVSREDVIEEIFGEIEDEYDQDHLIEQQLDSATFLLSARLEIDYLNEKYNWKLPIGEYETLSGLILEYTEDLPHQGDVVDIPPYTFTIQSTQGHRIDVVRMALEPSTTRKTSIL